MDWKHLLAYITGTVDQALLLRNEYLVTENRLLRNQITGRVHIPTDLVVAQEASDVESSSRLDILLLHNLRRRFSA
jgi:hypothetical protein